MNHGSMTHMIFTAWLIINVDYALGYMTMDWNYLYELYLQMSSMSCFECFLYELAFILYFPILNEVSDYNSLCLSLIDIYVPTG